MGLLDDAYTYWGDKAKILAGLLQAGAESGASAYAGATKPYTKEQAKTIGGLLADFTPVVGGVKGAIEEAHAGNPGWAAFNAATVPLDLATLGGATALKGLLGGVPAVAGMIKGPLGRIPETGSETRSLAEMLKRAGERAGYDVSHEGSAISPSQYVTFRKAGDEVGDMTRQVRLSNHADKYPELADGVRTSVDPVTEVSFEQAVNWLGREGFPTSLSTRYKDVPTWEQYYAAQRAKSPPVDHDELLQRLKWHWANNPNHYLYRGNGISEPTIEDALAHIAKFAGQ